ncbi:A32.5L, partial [Monkeypox virus]
MLKMSAADFLE